MLDFDLTSRAGLATIPVSTTGLKDPFGPDGSTELIEALKAAAELAAATEAHKNAETSDGTSMNPLSSSLSIPCRQNVHCLYGLSKDFDMGGVRMGFLVSRNAQVRAAASKVTWFTWLTVYSDIFVTHFLQQLHVVQDYLDTYRPRQAAEYHSAAAVIETHGIHFEKANAGLFIFIDLSRWIHYFKSPDEESANGKNISGPELLLCEWLIGHGVYLNAVEFAGCDPPGHFRLVFTQRPDATQLAIG
ncbi:Aminotran-1-2 domain-containing protein [Fusarium sp. LHS14.1]|nr:Aminotran-1-2 domain-containing protein [Fusarium sp. LHS14.1]